MNLRQSAKGRECQARIVGVCNYDPETTVLAHMNGAGMALKSSDLFGAFCCSACHSWLDSGYVRSPYSGVTRPPRMMRDLYHLEAIIRTQQIWLKEGLIKI